MTEHVTDNRAPAVTDRVTDNANDLATLHDIERRLDQGRIDAREVEEAIERADAILQAHEAVTIRANSLGMRLEKLLR